MRLVCLNAWGGKLFEPLMAFIAAVDADVLCLQEVTHAVEPSPDRLIFRHGGRELPQQADLFAAVGSILPNHRGQFCPAMQGSLFDVHGRSFASLFGLATFVRASLPVVAQIQGFVHGQFRADGWGEPPVPRNIHCLRLLLPPLGQTVTVGHLHGLRSLDGKADTPERQRQAEKIVGTIGAIRQPGEPAILCGDFNLMPDSATFDALRRIGLSDLVTASGYTDTRTSHYPKEPRFADYMLVTGGVTVNRFEVVAEPEVSDHRPLLLDFEIGDR